MKFFIVYASLFTLAGATIISSPKKASARKIELWSDQSLAPVAIPGTKPQCSSNIYCQGKVLHTIQMASIFADSKTFVDMKMKQSEAYTLQSFDNFMKLTEEKPTRPELRAWVYENFEERGTELENWTPPDYKEQISLYGKIKDDTFKAWAADLNHIWIELGREIKQEVRNNPSQYSIIPVPNPFIVAGGRFLELYYWDSYWIVRGLIQCEMYTTVKGIIENFVDLIETNGHIPNGARVYYNRRSQPPLLAGMMKSYLDATGDKQFIADNLVWLTIEFNFFQQNHDVTVNGHTLYRYIDYDSFGPRPESYREDYELGKDCNSNVEREGLYSELKAGAESGMDFTSRWFISDEINSSLKDIKARSIVPVDLNAFMYRNALLISEFYTLEGKTTQSTRWAERASTILTAINAVLWSEEEGSWFDYDMLNNKHRTQFTASNLSPLWVKAYRAEDEPKITEKVLGYIERNKLDDYPGGVPNTLLFTGEQWDFPNVWAPMQYMLIMGLDALNNVTAKNLAYKWADKWVHNNYLAFKEYKAMFEKYHALEPGRITGGGEYEIQKGFGWTNGVILELLSKYGDRLVSKDYGEVTSTEKSPESTTERSSANHAHIQVSIISLLLTIAWMLISV